MLYYFLEVIFLKKFLFISLICFLNIATPCFAKFNGSISQEYIYDVEKTIMYEIKPKLEVKNSSFWDNNFFTTNRYSTYNFLSNKNLYYNFNYSGKPVVLRRIATPSIYNISLKNSSLKVTPLNPTKKIVVTTTSAYEKALVSNDINEKIKTVIYLKNSDSKLALQLTENILKFEPQNAHVYFLRGEIYYKLQNYDKAMENYAHALQINPKSYQCCIGIAKILDKSNHELALKYYEKASSLK